MIIKVDSGPGQMMKYLLARLRTLGFILYPGVPNTTSVSQEADRLYGPFKSMLRKNLNLVVQACVCAEVSTSMQPWMCGLVIFGGRDTLTDFVFERSAFEAAFLHKHCRRA